MQGSERMRLKETKVKDLMVHKRRLVDAHFSHTTKVLLAKEPKLIKTEDSNVTLYQHQSLDDPNNSLRWVIKLNQSQGQFLNPFPLEVDAGLMAFSGGSNPQVRDTSTSTVFDRVGLQQVLDAAYIGIDFWPMPQHV
ncbi:hypothetical protein Fmac_001518 [Flemingia macrophylla]|uniref:Uncharacterized protein n=1 Tax=Flemingia macrophylla TaxID=520843 RepID=A0ABD1NHB7_9FABA